MTLKLIIGNKNYSSWSFRPWIGLKAPGIAFDEEVIPLYVEGSKKVHDLLCTEMTEITGGRFEWEPDPVIAADKIVAHIESKRDALHINTQKERKLYDMKSRRELQ